MSVKCDPTVQTTQSIILGNHSRYDFGNSCASKRRELHSLPIGWEEKKTTKNDRKEAKKKENEDDTC